MKRFLNITAFLFGLIGLVALFSTESIAKAPAVAGKALLVVEAANDRPGPVEIRIEGWDVKGESTVNTVLYWNGDNDSFSGKNLEIEKTTRVLRFTFLNDQILPEGEEFNRIALIDYFIVNNLFYDAHNWQRTGGITPDKQGCENQTLRSRTVVSCENTGDWVEYELHPGNPVKSGFTIQVDDTLEPAILPDVFRIDPNIPRPVATVTDQFGNQADFAENELCIATDDDALLNDILNRWQGEVISTFDPDDYGVNGLSKQYLVRINTSLADIDKLKDDLLLLKPGSTGDIRVSSRSGLGLLAAGADEAVKGVSIGINWVGQLASMFRDDSSVEAPYGTNVGSTIYDPNAFTWPTHSAGSVQDIGVAEAWKLLETAGKLNNTVRIADLDIGFQEPDEDYPNGWDATSMVSSVPSYGTPAPYKGKEWHGTMSLSAMAAYPDNNFGSAGPAGPIAFPIMITMSPFNFAKVSALGRAKQMGARIVNMNYSVIVSGAFDWSLNSFEKATAAFRDSGILLVAPAGNNGRNVDISSIYIDDFGFVRDYETAWFTPCENVGVICVGGLKWDSQRWHPDSNYGALSVDIFAPFTQLIGPTPYSIDDQTIGHANGTSWSSPFTAGIAALIWAADLTLTVDEVEDILLRTAHTTPYSIVNRYVNARVAVEEALSRHNNPPFIEITTPENNSDFLNIILFDSDTEDFEDGHPDVIWNSSIDGEIGTGGTISVRLSIGTHLITATATDSEGLSNSDSITVNVLNAAPRVMIMSVDPSTTPYQSQTIVLTGDSADPNSGSNGSLLDSQVSWFLDEATDPFATGHSAIIPGGELSVGGHLVKFAGSDGEFTAAESIFIQVLDNPTGNMEPTLIVSQPNDGDQFLANYVDSASGKRYAQVTLCGYGEDPEDGRLIARWFVKGVNDDYQPVSIYGYENPGMCPIIRLYLEVIGGTTYTIKARIEDSGGASVDKEIGVLVRTIL